MRSTLLSALLLSSLLFSCKKNSEGDPIPNNKALAWAKSFGGNEYEMIQSVVQLSDGSYVAVGNTRSSNGEFAGPRGGWDIWVSRLDANGTKQWFSFFGENNDDYATGIVPTSDGGYMISGYTYVANTNTAWVAKVNGTGARQWQKNLSTSSDAKALSLAATNDGNFVVAGYVSGAGKEGWVAKVDNSGNTVWSKTFGGSGDDIIEKVITLSDGSYAVAGQTTSGTGDLSSNRGAIDGWIMRVDASGNRSWSQSYGGSRDDILKSITTATDGGLVAVGYTMSTGGDIPSSKGGNEEWIIKVNGSSGAKEWVKTYGGINEEYIYQIVPSREGGFITVGYTNSTTGDVVRRDNDFGAWLLRVDGSGNKVTTSTYGRTPQDDIVSTIIPTADGGYLMAGNQWIDGNGYDGWVIKIDNF